MRLVRGGLILPAICAVVAACSGGNHTMSITSTASAPEPPVGHEALGSLLLSPSEINVVMGATAMTVKGTYDKVDDHSAVVANKDCVTMYGPGEPSAYAGSGANATHAQFLSDAADNSSVKHSVFQTVVSFPTANQAAAFFTASSQRWPACSNLRYTITGLGAWDVGPVANTNGTLSATETRDTHTWTCQRALTVRNNVAIDVTGCGNDRVDGAVDVTRWIAANVTDHFVGPGY
jgi:serine/threonine kinase PknH